MQNLIDFIGIQLLAEGGESAGGEAAGEAAADAASVEPSADDGQARLLELGVPENRIRKNRAYKVPQPVPDTASQEPAPEPEQAAAAEPEQQPTEAKRLTWDEIMQDPEYNKAMQETMQKRIAKSKQAEEKLSKLAPALELIGRSLNIDVSDMDKFDTDAFVKAVTEDSAYYEDKAAEMGIPVETAMRIDQLEREKARRDKEEAQSLEDQRIQQHFMKLQSQAETLRETFPNFDLETELRNPAFFRMTSPEIGLSVQDAYYAVHREELQRAAMQVAAQKVSEKMSNSIQSGMRRPVENGAQPQPASVSTFDYRHMSPEQRANLKRQINEAAARGEKLYPTR